MDLTVKECELLYQMFNASISIARMSGIPIGEEHYNHLDSIREKLLKEEAEARRKEYHPWQRPQK